MATPKALVVGSGVIGLRTSLELLRRNVSVTLRSIRPPWDSSVCSQGAGGLWMPYHCDDERTDRWALETLNHLLEKTINEGKDQNLVEIVPTVVLKKTHGGPTVEDFVSKSGNQNDATFDGVKDNNRTGPLPQWSQDSRLAFQHLTVEMLRWQNRVHKLRIPSLQTLLRAGYKHAWLFHPPIVDAPNMLKAMLDEIQSHASKPDVNVETNYEYQSIQDMVQDAKRLDCNVVVNCTGLGSRDVCSDKTMVGARGILLHYDRQSIHLSSNEEQLRDATIMTEESPWGSETEPCYMIPRGNILVVGGSYLEGNTESETQPSERDRLLRNAELLGIDVDKNEPIGEWTGFRPVRATVRCEIDEEHGKEDKIRVVHCYGHGGSGWTVFVGAAADTADLVVNDAEGG